MQVEQKVREIIAEALYLDIEVVSENSKLVNELGAESIDFLDIIFRLEQEFKLKIDRGFVEKNIRKGLRDHEFAVDGVLQEPALQNIRELMPEVDPGRLRGGLKTMEIPTLYTVQTLINLVKVQLEDKQMGSNVVPLNIEHVHGQSRVRL